VEVSCAADAVLTRVIHLLHPLEESRGLGVEAIGLLCTEVEEAARLLEMTALFAWSGQVIKDYSSTCPVVWREMAAMNPMVPRQRVRRLGSLHEMQWLPLRFQLLRDADELTMLFLDKTVLLFEDDLHFFDLADEGCVGFKLFVALFFERFNSSHGDVEVVDELASNLLTLPLTFPDPVS
jgi:hypothetical protein